MIFCPSWALNWNKSIVIVIVIIHTGSLYQFEYEVMSMTVAYMRIQKVLSEAGPTLTKFLLMRGGRIQISL